MRKITHINTQPAMQHDVKVTVDTLHLTAKLSKKEETLVYDNFTFNQNNQKKFHWHYSQLETRKLGIVLHSKPVNTFTCKHYNHMIQLQQQMIAAKNVPASVNEVIKQIDWNIKRIDIAFDFKSPIENSLIIKHHGLVQFEPPNDKWNTDYLSKLKTRSPSKLAHYDRNTKEQENETGVTHEYNNRFEARLFPASNDETMKLHSFQDDFIIKHLKKYIIIPDIEALPVGKRIKNKLYKLQHNPDYMKTLKPKQQKELKAIINAYKAPLDQIYLANKHTLLPFLTEQSAAVTLAI